MAKEASGTLPAIAGFVVVAGGMLPALWLLLTEPPPALPWAEAEAAAEAADGPDKVAEEDAHGSWIYVPLTKELEVGLGRGMPVLKAMAIIAVRGSTEELPGLNALVTGDLARIESAMMAEVLDMMTATTGIDAIHRELPTRLRDAANRVIGSETDPAPVDEVMLTSVVLMTP